MLQVFHALFENIHVDYKYSPAKQSARFAVYSVQIDNQLLSSTHPVVLCHSSSGGHLMAIAVASCAPTVLTVSPASPLRLRLICLGPLPSPDSAFRPHEHFPPSTGALLHHIGVLLVPEETHPGKPNWQTLRHIMPVRVTRRAWACLRSDTADAPWRDQAMVCVSDSSQDSVPVWGRGVLHAGVVAAPKAAVEEGGESVPQQTMGQPFVEVQWEMLHHNPSILYFRALLLQIQVTTLVLLDTHSQMALSLDCTHSPGFNLAYGCAELMHGVH